jgi:TolA-binding protein
MKLFKPVHVSIAALAIGVGAWSLPSVAQTAGDRARDAGHDIGNTARDMGDKIAGSPGTQPADKLAAPDANDIRGALAKATEQAVDKNGFDNLISRFVDADRDRIKQTKLTDEDWKKLNGRIEQFRQDWKAKYNQDFNIKDEKLVFDPQQVLIVQGEIWDRDKDRANAAQPAGSRMPGETPGQTSAQSGQAQPGNPSMPDERPGPEANKTAGGDTNREPGRNVAKVTIPESHGMPAVYIPMIHEFPDTWKIDVPDQVDGRKLYDNLLAHLTFFNEHKDQWPADVNDAYRAAAHHVAMAVMDMPVESKGMTGGMGGTPGHDTNTNPPTGGGR